VILHSRGNGHRTKGAENQKGPNSHLEGKMQLVFVRALILSVFAVSIGILLAHRDSQNAYAQGNFAPASTYSLSSTAPSAASDTTFTLNLPNNTLNFGGTILAAPGGACAASGPGYLGSPTTCGTAAPLLGDTVGTLSSSTFLGVSGNPCSTNLTVTFVFLNATVDNSAGNLVYPSTQPEADQVFGTLGPLLHDVNTLSAPPDDADGGSQAGAVSVANGLPAHVDRYPAYLNVVFDPDTPAGPALPLQPLVRYSGGQIVVGTAVILTNQVFAPGALLAFTAPHPYGDFSNTNLGYGLVSTLQDPTAPVSPNAISDFCTPLILTSTLFGVTRTNPCNGGPAGPNPNPVLCSNDGVINNPAVGVGTGRNLRQNPATAGTHFYGAYIFSQRDLDGDGYENAFDTCPYNANTDGNPRTTSGPDTDMLDSSCDPGPGTNNTNQDGDSGPNGGQWPNALDNCPLIGNTTNGQEELLDLENVRRPRGGSSADDMGDACDGAETSCGDALDNDAFPSGPEGLINDGCPAVGTSGAETVCTGNVDNDGDGFVNDGCPANANETGAECAPPNAADDDGDGATLVNDGCPAVGAAESGPACANAVSDDDDVAPGGIGPEDAVNDGCPAAGPPRPALSETAGAQCSNYVSDDDDNGDGSINASDLINDGCATVGTADEPGCLNSFDDDADTVVNDGCASSSKVANGHYHTDWDLLPLCIGGTDGDGDGWCAAPLAATDPIIDPDDGNAGRTPEHYAVVRYFPVAHSGSGMSTMGPGIAHPREPLQACNDGIDNDGDGAIDLLEQDGADGGVTGMWDCNPRSATLPVTDTDGDGYPDANEIYVGTDPLGRCERTGTGVSQSNDWPADHVGGATSGDKITLTDISTYTATPKRFNTKPGDANFLPRYDVNPGTTTPGATQNWIVLTDLSNISSLTPAMFNGVKAFGGPTCAAHLTLND